MILRVLKDSEFPPILFDLGLLLNLYDSQMFLNYKKSKIINTQISKLLSVIAKYVIYLA